MEKRNHKSRQTDLFAHDPQKMQWENFPEKVCYQTQRLFSQLVLNLFSHLIKLQTQKEHSHAAENNV